MHEKAVLERLQSYQLNEDSAEDEFVHVGDEKASRDVRLDRHAEGLPVSLMASWQSRLLDDPKNRLALSALSANNPKEILTQRSAKIEDQQVFNIKIPFEGAPITNQRSSGRCWLFASTNVFRVALMKRYNLDSFELSQAYLFFWDKLEKSNYFLENIIDTANEDLESRLVQRILAEPVSDGGQWDMVYNLVEKYGLVPQALYPDSYNAMSSGTVNYIVIAKLREYALTLRKLLKSSTTTAATLAVTKQKMMREIHLILTLTLGPPPSSTDKFEWNFIDKNGKARCVRASPLDFAKDIASPEFRLTNYSAISSMVSLVHDPRHEPLTLMTVDRLGNIVGGRGITYINVSIPTLKQACISMLKAGLPVFFGSDVGKFSNSTSGIMDLNLIDYELGFNINMLGLDKAARLRVGESAMTHAMVLTAVHVDGEGKSVRWRVQNSWGEAAGDKGWFVMSDRWMDEFVYQAVIDPRFLVKEVKDVLKKEPVVLPLWDPMGSLA
ncbi:peptidase C1-like family protein [Pseudomassariella vexata]|uniref:Cysteine proteinase 1, mitochondrial n=1 Tax=Pseudomassariella vexata TaxID=1141098 RepID=A0A1Y2DMS1_9PEZI|nr:peptidase C1-like family protein [Pseudomassariella vexata]ORY60588.1 peptidase C1-like family protein [Pseudomassariella vexata]